MGADNPLNAYAGLMAPFWQKVKAAFGLTWDEYLAALPRMATRYAIPGEPVYAVQNIFDQAIQSLAASTVTSTLTAPVQAAAGDLLPEQTGPASPTGLPCTNEGVVLWVYQAGSLVRLAPGLVNPEQHTTIIIHGWNLAVSIRPMCTDMPWMTSVAAAIAAQNPNENILLVDWRLLATYPLPDVPGGYTEFAGHMAAVSFISSVPTYYPPAFTSSATALAATWARR